MTATEPASLDALLRTATPVEAEPFDLDGLLMEIQRASWAQDRYHAREQIARHVNALRCTIDDRERIAANLEADAANVDRRIAEAVRWLETAESYSVDEDCSAAIDDAMAALRGETS